MLFTTLGARPAAVLIAATAVAVAPPAAVLAWQPDTPDPSAASEAAEERAQGSIRFNFKGATFDQVIDFFSRVTGLPVVREADVPQGTLDYLAPEQYTLPEALTILNIILHAKGVALRVDDDMLYLQKLTEMQRENIPTFVGRLPADVNPQEIITVVRPLEIALAKPLAEKLASMVAEYGSITAMDQQNSIVITETAGQVRRLLTIVDTLDREDPEGAVEVFAVRHARATELMGSLKALLAQKVEKYVIDQKGKQVKIEEESMPGLSISADERTNAIIAKGVQSRIDKLREAIELLDVPAVGGGRAVRTFALSRLAPREVTAKLEALYAKLPEEKRPTIMALDDLGKVTLIGDMSSIEEASALLHEIDGGAQPEWSEPQRAIAVIGLDYAEPDAVTSALQSLLNNRQRSSTKMITGPDGRSLVVAGLTTDVDAVKLLVPVLDRPPAEDRTARLFRVAAGDARRTFDRSRALYADQTDPDDPQWRLDFDFNARARLLTVVGAPKAVQRFAESLRAVEENTVIERETRQIELAGATPSDIVAPLTALARPLLEPRDGGEYVAPEIAAVDALGLLIVTARPEQFHALESLVETLDRPGREMPPLRILQLRTADADNLAQVLARQYEGRPHDERMTRPVSIASDGQTNSLIVAAHSDLFGEIQSIVAELNRAGGVGGAEREIRIFPLTVARAPELARTIDEMFPAPPVPRDRRGRALYHLQQPREVVVRADPQTNSLIVDAPVERMAGFEQLVEQLDRQQITDEGAIRTYRIVHADLNAVAGTLRQLAASGSLSPAGRDRRVPIDITSEPMSRTLVVSGPDDIFDRVEEVLGELDARRVGPSTTLRFFTLRNARAEALVPMLREILLRRIAEDIEDPGPDAGRLLHLSADRKTNTLILSAPAAILPVADALVSELDHPRAAVEAVDVRIFQLAQADAAQVANALREAVRTRAEAEGDVSPVTIAAEPSSNSIVVTAIPAQVERIGTMIESLDGAPPADQIQVRTVFLKHARAERVAPLVSELLARDELMDVNQLPSWARVQFVQMQMRQGGPEPTVRVVADARLNAVVISAPAALLNAAEQMVSQLDVDPSDVTSASARRVRVLVIANADATEMAANLTAIFDQEEQVEPPPTIRVDRESNSLLVLATGAQFNTIEQIARQIDDATIAASREMRLIPLDPGKASAAELARTLQRMLGRPGGSGVKVISLEELLQRQSTSQGKTPGPTSSLPEAQGPSPWPAPYGAIASMAIGVLQDQPPDPPDGGGGLVIAVDPATNSLVIVGAPRAIDRVADLVRQLVDQLPAAPGQIHYVGLPEAVNAATTSRMIIQAISQMTPPGGRRGDLRRRVAVIADQANNALIVACNEHDFEIVGDLIAALSRPATTEQMVVKVYPLQTVAAERAAESVRQMLSPTGPGRQRGRQAQRMRDLAVTLLVGDQTIEAVFDPQRVRVNIDPQNNALIVMGPPEAIGFVDQFVELLDQTPVNVQTTLKLYPLQHARAREIRNTLRGIFRARFQSMQPTMGAGVIMPEFSADERTNTLLVTASPEQLTEVDGLLQELDRKLGEDRHTLRMIELTAAQPRQAAQILDQVVIGSDQTRRSSTLIVPDDNTGVLLVRAGDDVMNEIDEVLAEIDRPSTREFKVRTIVLERADAAAVATALQQLYDDRARIASSGRGRRQQARRVSIIGDSNSNTVLVAASDDDFGEIEQLVGQFDTPQASQALSFRVFQLRHAKASEIEQTVQNIINEISFAEEGPWWAWWGRSQSQGRSRRGVLAVQADVRLNALVVTGEGDKFEVVEQLIDVLDAPAGEGERRIVKLYLLQHADVDVVADVLVETFAHRSRYRRWWEMPDPTEVRIRTDSRNKIIIVYGTNRQQEEIGEFIAGIDSQAAPGEQQFAVLSVEFARARDLAGTLNQFMRDRARATGAPPPNATIVGSQSANALLVSAEADELAMLRDLLGRLDQPDVSGDRTFEIIALTDGDAEEIARIVTRQFRGRSGGPEGGTGVVVTPDARTNSLIINAPKLQFAQVRALIERLDAPSASDETIIRTYALEGARAEDAVRILSDTLQLDARGETSGITIRLEDDRGPAVEVRAKIVADRRSNSIIVTATEESFPVIETLIAKLDDVPAASPVEYRIIPLKHALAIDVAFTLRQFTRDRGAADEAQPNIDYNRLENQLIVAATADQFEQIQSIIAELDRPSESERITDFVPLRFAQAQQVQEALSVFYGPYSIEADTPGKLNARIVADPAANSLVITADESEWANIRALLDKLDSEEYDVSLQLRVIPLTYADARSVARAINEAFATEISRGDRRPAGRQPARMGPDAERRDQRDYPTVLVESEEWVRASAETQTNSVIVSASRSNIRKIEQIVTELDVADYAKLPPPRIIPVTAGSPEQLADSLKGLYEQTTDDRGRKALRIVGDRASNSIIVRAEEEDFHQIKALAEALQGEASQQGLSVYVLRLRAAPVRRVAEAVRDAFAAKAREADIPLAIQTDVQGNSLVIACTASMFEEIRGTVEQLDALSPAAGHGIFIIELEHVSPEAARNVVETIGLHEPPRDDSTSRLVTEPIRVVPLSGRNAIVVVANPADRETIIGLFKAIDSEPGLAEARLRVVKLRNADASALAEILRQILQPGQQQAETALARAVQEQVRRLSMRGPDTGDLRLDLTKPIRIIADTALNALVISSTPDNVDALAEVVAIFDELPITDAVTVQLLPLSNIAADDFARIVRELFVQGKQLGRIPGADLQGVPAGRIGKALLDEVALSVDQRTNTVIVAGKVDAVALVEVLHRKIDRDVANGWIEPRIVPLRFADAEDLAEVLQAVLVDGTVDQQAASPLQRQVARLRMARLDTNGGRVLEADVFSPMTRLVIRPEPKLNALVLVGTPMNLEVVTELVQMLDIESAGPGAAVRIYPLEHASASRLATTITRLFDQQVQAGTLRRDDRVIIQADERTNALVVTTSRSSFPVVEGLIDMLDTRLAPELRAIRQIELANASATRVGTMAQQLMDARLERLRRTEPETAELYRATIIADVRTNSLVIAAGPETFEVVKRLVEDLDRSTLTTDAMIRVIPVTRANAERMAETIDAVMQRRYADMPDDLRESQQPLVLTDPGSGSLLVAAGPDDLAAIVHLVEKLEEAPRNPAIRLAVIPVESEDASMLAPRIQTVMRQRQQSLGQAGVDSDRVAIEPDDASNSLIIAASEENIEVIRDLVSALTRADWDSEGGTEIELVQLISSQAAEVVDLLGELYADEVNRRRGTDTVQVSADERLNAVLINAPGSDLRALKNLIARLDGTKPASVVEIKYIALSSANALETVSLIQNILAGRGIGSGRGTQQATVLRYLREYAVGRKGDGSGDDPMSEMEVSAAVRDAITLTPDLRTNTIIVSAPGDSMNVIERMVRDLDASSMGAQNVRIFKLENADAIAMAEILTDLFNLSQRGNLYVLKPRERRPEEQALSVSAVEPDAPYAALLGAELTAVPDDRQELSITVDNRTNSLIVSGTPLYLDLVEEVVQNLDALEANERDVFVYPLRNAVASEVADVLTEFVSQEQQKLLGTLSPDQLGSASRLLEREITIVGDEKSNTVLVSASPRYMSRVKQMITDLDVDPPQVLIQVLLAEITLDSDLEWGFDTRAELGPYGGDDLLFRGASSLASAFLPTLGIPSFSVSTDDFSLLLKALEAQGRVQVLSNPSVMAANNQPARIQVGENIGRASSGSITSDFQQVLVEFIDIGVILEVTPSINPDGFVRMSVVPEITILTNETTQITEDLEVPILTKRTASTTVTVRDGQTIVIGGLIQDMYELRQQKVPLLGDIPLLGLLFRSEFEESAKTELLIVLTPHVISSPTNFARVDEVTDREIDRMSVSPQERKGLEDSFLVPEERTWRERIKDEQRKNRSGRESGNSRGPQGSPGEPPAGFTPENDPEIGDRHDQ